MTESMGMGHASAILRLRATSGFPLLLRQTRIALSLPRKILLASLSNLRATGAVTHVTYVSRSASAVVAVVVVYIHDATHLCVQGWANLKDGCNVKCHGTCTYNTSVIPISEQCACNSCQKPGPAKYKTYLNCAMLAMSCPCLLECLWA